jgi:hypothetical protein
MDLLALPVYMLLASHRVLQNSVLMAKIRGGGPTVMMENMCGLRDLLSSSLRPNLLDHDECETRHVSCFSPAK